MAVFKGTLWLFFLSILHEIIFILIKDYWRYQKGDIDEHGYLSPAVNRAPGSKNIAADNRIQSHHPIQNEWAKNGDFDYNEKKAQAILLPSSSGLPHAKISAMQRKRRRIEGYDTDIRYEFNVSYREMIEAGVD
ncbi:hypothetical protein [Bacillus sp. 491mf]|uniref:hypothetical protein n=1 Tax=Bacillus sp. 491mf TaxID=1761755 RepID=UPI00210B0D19|nr:hypothetical protein [Bacillus sp. 491mf]